MVHILPDQPVKGRGAASNSSGRFEPLKRMRIDDGWQTHEVDPEPKRRTRVTPETPRTIIARNTSPDVPFDRSINPYRGCEHGCVYCFARPTHAYYGLSAGLDFETELFSKPEAAALLEKEIAHPKYRCRTMALGTNTDPYQPVERRHEITRGVLKVLAASNHPFTIVTKSDLVLRDLDIIAPMAEKGLAAVGVSLTTLDGRLARTLEPRVPAPGRRLKAVAELAEARVPTVVMAAPVIPALNDMELENLLETAAGAGAFAAGYILMRLPGEIKALFEEWLVNHYPDRAGRVLSLIRQTRGGTLYRSQWGERMIGSGAYADLIQKRFSLACKRFQLVEQRTAEHALRTDLFRPPILPGDQLRLF